MLTNYFKKKIMGEVFNISGQSGGVSSYYIGLSTTNPQTSSVTEPSGGSYARKNIPSSSLSMSSTDGSVTNSSDISFTESTDGWGTISYWVLYDSSTSGNLLAYGALPASRTVETGTIVKIKANSLSFTLSDNVS